ncbi:MAG TPA: 30S ribosomal protein S16 [Candidatus Saccharimonadales bacterium]|nr:30S ribosomal protein S16 [Candidatus Saccharimonadales bacterium]
MLAIRMQRTGRKGHAMFRVVVQDSRVTPTSGKVVALLGSYDPHTKSAALDKTQAENFLKNGAQPSDRIAALFKQEGIRLPEWVTLATKKVGKLRNPEKLRKNQPKEAAAPVETPAEEPAAEAAAAEATSEAPAAETDAEKTEA